MKALSLTVKIILLGILPAMVLTAGLTGLSVYQAYRAGQQEVEAFRKNMRAAKEAELKNYVDLAISAIRPLYENAAADDKNAQEQARNILRKLAYGQNGYLLSICTTARTSCWVQNPNWKVGISARLRMPMESFTFANWSNRPSEVEAMKLYARFDGQQPQYEIRPVAAHQDERIRRITCCRHAAST